jgi:hypothetical protein
MAAALQVLGLTLFTKVGDTIFADHGGAVLTIKFQSFNKH